MTATQYNYPLLCAPIIIIYRMSSLYADESFDLKHKKIFEETFGVYADKKSKFQKVYEHINLYAKEKTFDSKDVEVFRNR